MNEAIESSNRLLKSRDTYEQGDTADVLFDAWRAEAAAYARALSSAAEALGDDARAQRMAATTVTAARALLLIPQRTLLTNSALDDYVARQLMAAYAKMMDLLSAKAKFTVLLTNDVGGLASRFVCDEAPAYLQTCALKGGVYSATRVAIVRALAATARAANAAKMRVKNVDEQAWARLVCDARGDVMLRDAVGQFLYALRSPTIAAVLSSLASDQDTFVRLWSSHRALQSEQCVAIVRRRLAADTDGALVVAVLSSLSTFIQNRADLSLKETGGRGADAAGVEDDERHEDSNSRNYSRSNDNDKDNDNDDDDDDDDVNGLKARRMRASIIELITTADANAHSSYTDTDDERCSEMLELMLAVVRRWPSSLAARRVLCLCLQRPTVESLALVQSTATLLPERAWLRIILPATRRFMSQMSLGGVSGKQQEQEVIDLVRECARIHYINRDSLASARLGRALFVAILEAMRHGYIETERMPLLAAMIVAAHAPASVDDHVASRLGRIGDESELLVFLTDDNDGVQNLDDGNDDDDDDDNDNDHDNDTGADDANVDELAPFNWASGAFHSMFCSTRTTTRAIHEFALRLLGLFDIDIDTMSVCSLPSPSVKSALFERLATLPLPSSLEFCASLCVVHTSSASSSTTSLDVAVTAAPSSASFVMRQVNVIPTILNVICGWIEAWWVKPSLSSSSITSTKKSGKTPPPTASRELQTATLSLLRALATLPHIPCAPQLFETSLQLLLVSNSKAIPDTLLARVVDQAPRAHHFTPAAIAAACSPRQTGLDYPLTRAALAPFAPEICLRDSAALVRVAALEAVGARADLALLHAADVLRAPFLDDHSGNKVRMDELDLLLASTDSVQTIASEGVLLPHCLLLLIYAARVSARNDMESKVHTRVQRSIDSIAEALSVSEIARLSLWRGSGREYLGKRGAAKATGSAVIDELARISLAWSSIRSSLDEYLHRFGGAYGGSINDDGDDDDDARGGGGVVVVAPPTPPPSSIVVIEGRPPIPYASTASASPSSSSSARRSSAKLKTSGSRKRLSRRRSGAADATASATAAAVASPSPSSSVERDLERAMADECDALLELSKEALKQQRVVEAMTQLHRARRLSPVRYDERNGSDIFSTQIVPLLRLNDQQSFEAQSRVLNAALRLFAPELKATGDEATLRQRLCAAVARQLRRVLADARRAGNDVRHEAMDFLRSQKLEDDAQLLRIVDDFVTETTTTTTTTTAAATDAYDDIYSQLSLLPNPKWALPQWKSTEEDKEEEATIKERGRKKDDDKQALLG